MNLQNRTIFEGDNLYVLRGLDSETIYLIYLDPPSSSADKTKLVATIDRQVVLKENLMSPQTWITIINWR